MSEQRVRDLEIQVGDMREDNARLNEAVGHLAVSVDQLTVTVDGLRDTMNRGRGALYGLGAIASLIGGSAAIAAQKLFGAH